jgi:hypothetical protein
MRWLFLGLVISVGALLIAAGALLLHILRQRRATPYAAPESAAENQDAELGRDHPSPSADQSRKD